MEESRNFPFLSNAFLFSFYLFLNRDDRLSSFVDNSFQVPRKNGLSIERPVIRTACVSMSARAVGQKLCEWVKGNPVD